MFPEKVVFARNFSERVLEGDKHSNTLNYFGL